MIKLFVSDMDGTLLNENHIISDNTANAIRTLQKNGIEFMIATGRSYASAMPLLQHHELDAQMINLNGAAIYDSQGKLLSSIPIESKSFQEMIDFCTSNQLDYSIMTEHNIYVQNREAFIERTVAFLRMLKDNNPSIGKLTSDVQFISEISHVKSIDEYKNMQSDHPLKIMTFSDNPDDFMNFKNIFDKYDDLDITSSSIDNLEITHRAAQKGLAIKKYIMEQGYDFDQVATIGDSLNDRSMLKMAKYSFAMANAPTEVKDFANYLAPSNREEGVAKIIEEIIRGKYS